MRKFGFCACWILFAGMVGMLADYVPTPKVITALAALCCLTMLVALLALFRPWNK